MATASDAEKAIKKLNQYQIGHKRLKVAYSLPSGERTRNINLYIKVRKKSIHLVGIELINTNARKSFNC